MYLHVRWLAGVAYRYRVYWFQGGNSSSARQRASQRRTSSQWRFIWPMITEHDVDHCTTEAETVSRCSALMVLATTCFVSRFFQDPGRYLSFSICNGTPLNLDIRHYVGGKLIFMRKRPFLISFLSADKVVRAPAFSGKSALLECMLAGKLGLTAQLIPQLSAMSVAVAEAGIQLGLVGWITLSCLWNSGAVFMV